MGLFFRKKKEDKKSNKNDENKQKIENESTETKSTKKEANIEKKTEKQTKNGKNESEKSKKPVYRVVYDKDSRLWLIKKDGAKRTIASFVTKEEALNRVKDLSSSNDLNYVVHKKNGKFQKK